jgi:valyl-tRNA synthetase
VQDNTIEDILSHREWLKRMAKIKEVASVVKSQSKALHFHYNNRNFYVPVGDILDIEAEVRKIDEEMKRLNDWKSSLEKKLQNKSFVDNAPVEVVEKEQQKLNDAIEKLEALKKRKTSLST